jgi:betaine-aldehyde dehydrogenase
MDVALKPQSVRSYTQLISGAWSGAGGESVTRRDPSSGDVVGEFQLATGALLDKAVEAAHRAFESGIWSHKTASERGRILLKWVELIRRHHERLAEIEAREVGKPIRLARGDIGNVIAMTEYAAALAFDVHGENYDRINGNDLAVLMREPVGVVAAIVPWNFPAVIYAQKVPFALSAGCTVVVKPSELTPGTAFELSLLAHEAGVPGDALNVIMGGADVGRALTVHPLVNMVTFTGSTIVGSKIAAAAGALHKHVALELGGKGGAIVLDDADLDDALDGVLFGAYYNQGEACCADTRLIVQEEIADIFVKRLSAWCSELKMGSVMDENTDVGPMVTDAHRSKVLNYIDEGVREGAKLVVGGPVVGADIEGGFFVAPTVLDNVTPAMRVFREEIFGPVLSVIRVKDADEAIRVANDCDYGLGASVWTKNVDRAITLGRALRAGSVWVNTTMDGAPQLPFGGYKASGSGREKGRAGLDEFLTTKCLHIHVGPRKPIFAAAAGKKGTRR